MSQKTLGFRVSVQEGQPALKGTAVPARDDDAGRVKWMGPGHLILSPDGDTQVVCKVELNKPVEQEILMVDSATTASLPADVFLLPMVMPSGPLDVSSLRVLVKNESSRETSIPEGALLGGMYYIDSVSTIPPKEIAHSDFDGSVVNFRDSPISEQWKDRLRKKLAQKSHVFSA